MKTIPYELLADLVDELLEQRRICFGLYSTISWLFDYGLTVEQIESLGYDIQDIDTALSMQSEEGIDE